jgi:hypothetical protein
MKHIEDVRNSILQTYARRCIYILIAMAVFACPNLLLDGIFQEKKGPGMDCKLPEILRFYG